MCGAELSSLPEGVQRVARVLQDKGHPHSPVMLDDAARTAQQAADALGIAVGQIAKSIIFRRKSDDAAVLVITSGDRRVDEKKVDALVGKTGRADAEFVKARTGFSIGGVSPIGHAAAAGDADRPRAVPLRRDLGRRRPSAWRVQAAAAGPGALTGAPVADVVQAPAHDGRGANCCWSGARGTAAGRRPGALALHLGLPHGRGHRPVRRLLPHAGRDRRAWGMLGDEERRAAVRRCWRSAPEARSQA
jgi:hypothetical protein